MSFRRKAPVPLLLKRGMAELKKTDKTPEVKGNLI
jgi:hypothetical protein